MIAASAVHAYLTETLDSYEWIKEVPRSDLIDAIEQLNPKPTFHTRPGTDPPWTHQLACFFLGVTLPSFCLFLDMRLGKTRVMLDVFAHRKRVHDLSGTRTPFRALVLVPQLIHLEPWREQVPVHTPHLRVQILEGSSSDRIECLAEGDADIYVINYSGLAYALSQKVESAKKKRAELVPDPKKVAWAASRFQFIVCDESTSIKNHQSLIFKVCRLLMPQIPYRYALTGTPFGRTPHDLWAQFYLIDGGQTLGQTLGIFRAAFFTEKKKYWGGYEYIFCKQKEQALHRRLQHRSICYELDDCLDVPKKVYVPLQIAWADDALPYYDQVHTAYTTQALAAIERENHFIRLRQITAGFLHYTTPDGAAVDIEFADNPKLDALLSLLGDIPVGRKFVLFHFFVRSGDLITRRLTHAQMGHVRIWSATKNRAALLTQFRTDPTCRVLLINESIGAMALDLQCANYIGFYDIPVSPIIRAQAEARCRGPKQTHTSFIHDFIMKNSVDTRIAAFVAEGRNLRDAVIANKVDL